MTPYLRIIGEGNQETTWIHQYVTIRTKVRLFLKNMIIKSNGIGLVVESGITQLIDTKIISDNTLFITGHLRAVNCTFPGVYFKQNHRGGYFFQCRFEGVNLPCIQPSIPFNNEPIDFYSCYPTAPHHLFNNVEHLNHPVNIYNTQGKRIGGSLTEEEKLSLAKAGGPPSITTKNCIVL
jgi:hypothetical protein